MRCRYVTRHCLQCTHRCIIPLHRRSGYFLDCNNLCPASLCTGGRFANFLPNWETRVAQLFLCFSYRIAELKWPLVSRVNYIPPLSYSCDHTKFLGFSYKYFYRDKFQTTPIKVCILLLYHISKIDVLFLRKYSIKLYLESS